MDILLVSLTLFPKLPQVVVNSQFPPSTSTVASENQSEWLPRTNITLQPFTDATRAFTISLNPQSSHIKSILRAASRHGAIKLLTDHEFCGLETTGLHGLTFASLVHCSDAKGYDGELDISHRLEKGDFAQYILPLVKYVLVFVFILRHFLVLILFTIPGGSTHFYRSQNTQDGLLIGHPYRIWHR